MPIMKTPSRRVTMGGLPNSQARANRRQSVGGQTQAQNSKQNQKAPPGGGLPAGAANSNKVRPPRGRASMIPRVGRENMIPPSPTHSVGSTGSTGSASTAKNNRRRSVGGRQSFGGDGRRQSLLPPAGPPVPTIQNDPRPINDKAFQNQCVKQILKFLGDNGYAYKYNRMALVRPSGKDFTNIVTFLMQRVDPMFQDGSGTTKIEDEIVASFKQLGYPYNISKTALVAAGSPHSWPALLATLSWLVDHIVAVQEEERREIAALADLDTLSTDLAELKEKSDKIFFQYLAKSYNAYMANDFGRKEQLEIELSNRFELDDNNLEQELDRVRDLNAAVEGKIAQVETMGDELPEALKKRDEYATDLEQYKDLIRNLEDHKAGLQKKVAERSSALTETNDALNKMGRSLKELQDTIANQELSIRDVHKIDSLKKECKEAIERVQAKKEEHANAVLQWGEKISHSSDLLDRQLSEYNSILSQLATMPELGKKFAGLKAELNKKNVLAEEQSAMLGVDFQASILPAVTKANRSMIKKADQAKETHQDSLDSMATTAQTLKETTAQLSILQSKNTKLEHELDQEGEAQAKKLAKQKFEIESCENKVNSRRDDDAIDAQLTEFERQRTELEAERVQIRDEHQLAKHATMTQIRESIQFMRDEDDRTTRKISEVQQYKQKKFDKMVGVAINDDEKDLHLDD